MVEFFASQFTWETISGEVFWHLLLKGSLWSFLLAVGLRAVAWLFDIELRPRRGELAFWIIMPLFFLVVVFFVMSLSQVTGQQRGAPLLKGQIDGVVVGTRELPQASATMVTLIASVRNLGTPSVVEGWSLSVTPRGGGPIVARAETIPKTLTLYRSDQSPITLSDSDALYDKTVPTPIVTGGMQRGILLFSIVESIPQIVSHPGTKLTLSYRDIFGTTYSTDALVGSIEEEFAYYLGRKTFR